MAGDTKEYIVEGTTIKHGSGKGGAKLYGPGDKIKLTDDQASTIKNHLKPVEKKS